MDPGTVGRTRCRRWKGRIKRTLRLTFGLLVTGLTLYLAVRGVDLNLVFAALSSASLWPALLGMLAVALAILIKIARWQLLLNEASTDTSSAGGPQMDRRVGMAAAAFLAGQVLNSVYPLRTGEVSRILLVGGPGKEYARVAGTLAVEKLLDMAAFLALLVIQLFLTPLPAWLERSAVTLLTVLFLLILAITGSLAGRQRLLAAAGRFLPGRLQLWIAEQLDHLIAGFAAIRRPGSLALAAGLTVLIWIGALLPNFFALRALDISLPSGQNLLGPALLSLIAVQVGISAPSLPAKIGIFEYACILALQVYGVGQAAGLSYGILLHAIVYLPIFAAGLPSLWFAAARLKPA